MRRAAGFTLLELLLVLTLIGIGTGLAVVSIDRLASRNEERQWMDRTLQELRRLRNQAVLQGRPVQATVDFAQARIDSGAGNTLALPEPYQLRPLTDEDPPLQRLNLVFFPDGSVQEARFALVPPKGPAQEFHLTRVSGRIERLPLGSAR